MAKSGGGGGRTPGERSKAPKKPGRHEDTMGKAEQVTVNADTANDNARTMASARQIEAAARAALRTAFGG
jgi:hypothetical protein